MYTTDAAQYEQKVVVTFFRPRMGETEQDSIGVYSIDDMRVEKDGCEACLSFWAACHPSLGDSCTRL